MGIKLNTPESLGAADTALRQKIRNELILNKPPQGVMAGLYKKIPTNMRLLAENLVGVDRPITNKDFTNDELVEMAFLAQKQREVNAERERFFREQQQFDVYPEQKAKTKKRLQSFEKTRGKTSVDPYKSVGNDSIVSGRKVDKGYLDSVISSFTDPRYGVATTLGQYNVRETPEMDVIKDTYNFNKAERNLPSNPIQALQRMAVSPEIAGEYLANILGTKDRPINIELKRKFADGGGVFGAFEDPTMSSQMFEALADKTDMFNDPMGSETLGAVNRAIVGTPIDAVDLMGRVGETALRGAAKAGEGIIGALGSDEGMAKRFGRDIYGLGIAASTLAPMVGPRPRGKSNKALVLEAQKDKVKSPVVKQKLDEDMEFEAIDDALKDANLDLDETLSVQSNFNATERTLSTDDFSDILQNEFAIARDSGKSRGEAMADAMRNTEKAMSDMNMMDVVIDRPIQDKIFKRLDEDYEFGVSKAVKRREEAAANQAALRSQANQARMANQPRVSVEDAVRQQQELINFGIPEPTTQKPTLVTIQGGKD